MKLKPSLVCVGPIALRAVGVLLAMSALLLALSAVGSRPAHAVSSFARQTGLGCGACHTAFPQLTPFGRRFKLNGYTLLAPGTKPLGSPDWVPPVSAMTVFGGTRTAVPQDNAGSPLAPNDNITLQQASLFYAGAITEHIGAFVQTTYAGPAFGPPAASQFMWDNLDVRFAKSVSIGGMPVVYGVSVNNNPTVQDAWNTTPAWGHPFVNTLPDAPLKEPTQRTGTFDVLAGKLTTSREMTLFPRPT